MLIISHVIYKITYGPGNFINYMRSKFFKENYKKINKNLCLKFQERQITVETVWEFWSSYSGNDSLDISVLGAIQCPAVLKWKLLLLSDLQELSHHTT